MMTQPTSPRWSVNAVPIVAKDTWEIISTDEGDGHGYTAVVNFTVKNKIITENVRLMDHMTLDEIEEYMNNRLEQLQLIKPKLDKSKVKGMKKIEY